MKIFKIFLISISVLILLVLIIFFNLVQVGGGKEIRLRGMIGEGDEFSPNPFIADFQFAHKFVCKPGLKAVIAAKEFSDRKCGFPLCSCYVCTK